jgi:hypothetical protein
MSVRVSLSDIIQGMEFQSDEMKSYLNIQTGKVVTVDDEALYAAEDGDPEGFHDPDELKVARDILDGKEYLPLPDRFDIDEYRMMERYAQSVADDAKADELFVALRGRGAFRYFKDTVRRLGIADDWYAFRDRAFEQLAVEWCDENGVAFERS